MRCPEGRWSEPTSEMSSISPAPTAADSDPNAATCRRTCSSVKILPAPSRHSLIWLPSTQEQHALPAYRFAPRRSQPISRASYPISSATYFVSHILYSITAGRGRYSSVLRPVSPHPRLIVLKKRHPRPPRDRVPSRFHRTSCESASPCLLRKPHHPVRPSSHHAAAHRTGSSARYRPGCQVGPYSWTRYPSHAL